jgi:RNA polymerase-associated protein RTF1
MINLGRTNSLPGFVEDRPYAVETANGKHFKTTQYIRAAHGKAERNWPFITCSDSPFTEVCKIVIDMRILDADSN